jgi:hypothetical protein
MFKDRVNPHDPLLKAEAAPDGGRTLFKRLSREANGFGGDDVVAAASNLLINALRQRHGSRSKAEAAFDEIFGRSKSALLNHYDGAGNRRNVFAFDQVVHFPSPTIKVN